MNWHAQRLKELHARAPKRRQASKSLRFAHVPLPWGYRVFAIAGKGSPIVLYALQQQKMTGHGDTKITDRLVRQWGLNRGIRGRTLNRLTAAGLASVRHRGKKFQGCPLLTLHMPEPRKNHKNDDKSD